MHRHRHWHDRRCRYLVGGEPLSAVARAGDGRGVSDLIRALYAAAIRSRDRGGDGGIHLFPRDDLSLAPGRKTQAGRSAPIRLSAVRQCSQNRTILRFNQDIASRVSPYFPGKLVALPVIRMEAEGTSHENSFWSSRWSMGG